MNTQNERVLAYLHEHGTIDQGITLAWHPPITRLAARIADLKAAGHPVDPVGRAGKFARYGLTATEPAPRLPRCDCGRALDDVRDTIASNFVSGKCVDHGNQLVFRP